MHCLYNCYRREYRWQSLYARYEKKVSTVMVNNSTNQPNEQPSFVSSNHWTQKTTTHGVGNPGPSKNVAWLSYYVFTFLVPCCDVRNDFRITLYPQMFVEGCMSYLRYLCLFAYNGVLAHIVLCWAHKTKKMIHSFTVTLEQNIWQAWSLVFLPPKLSVLLKIIFFVNQKTTKKSLRKFKFLRYMTFRSRWPCDIQFH